MEFKDSRTIFTPSEARWAQDAALFFSRMPSLAQKLLDARIDFAKDKLPSYEPQMKTVRFAREDVEARLALNTVLNRLHEVALEHGCDEANQEKHVIAVSMSETEKRRLLQLAKTDHELAQSNLETPPEIKAVEQGIVADDMAMIMATSDIMEPDQAVALGDLLRDPEFGALHEQAEREDAERTVAATASVIIALETDLAQ